MKTALIIGLGGFLLGGSAMAANKYEYKAPAKTYSAPAKTYSPPSRTQEYKRQDRQNDNRRQDTYRAQQNRVVTDSIKKKNAEKKYDRK